MSEPLKLPSHAELLSLVKRHIPVTEAKAILGVDPLSCEHGEGGGGHCFHVFDQKSWLNNAAINHYDSRGREVDGVDRYIARYRRLLNHHGSEMVPELVAHIEKFLIALKLKDIL